MAMDYTKLESNKHVTAWFGPSADGSLGITDVGEPLANEINNVGGTSGVYNLSKVILWDGWSFGTEASETQSEPSLADSSTFEEFGQSNYGGEVTFPYPRLYGDNSNEVSIAYDLVSVPDTKLDVVVRIDGDVLNTTNAADGDFVAVYRVQSDGETNPFTPGEGNTYTKSFIPKGEFSHYIPVGDQAITSVAGSTDTVNVGDKGRYRCTIQGRDVTNMLNASTSDGDVLDIEKGGWWVATGSGSATVTFTHPFTNDTATITVTVS